MITVIDLKSKRQISPPRAAVLCLGNFDGIHLGHRRLIEETLARKRQLLTKHKDVVSGAWFFRTAPSETLAGKPVPQIMTLDEKIQKFATLGLDCVYLADFSAMRELSPTAFVRDVLQKECNCVFAVCGFNYHFAHKGAGDANTLKDLMNGNAYIVECFSVDSVPVSSSRIRSLLQEGDVQNAAKLLGGEYSLSAPVLHGKKLGREMGVPTINQVFSHTAVVPRNGIYVTSTVIDGTSYPSVSNIGVRPSVEKDGGVNCETHVLGFDGDLYGKSLTVSFKARIRDEQTFPSLSVLTDRIRQDIEETKKYYGI